MVDTLLSFSSWTSNRSVTLRFPGVYMAHWPALVLTLSCGEPSHAPTSDVPVPSLEKWGGKLQPLQTYPRWVLLGPLACHRHRLWYTVIRHFESYCVVRRRVCLVGSGLLLSVP